MDAVTHPQSAVADLVRDRFVAYRANLFERNPHFKEIVGRTPVPWAPAVLVLVPRGRDAVGEVRRTIGWLAPDDYRAELRVALGQAALGANRFDDAAAELDAVVDSFPETDIAPEALFWSGVARYRAADRDLEVLAQRWGELLERFPNSPWAHRGAPIEDR